MARISGVTIPDGKQVQIALTYVYGIGPRTSQAIVEAAKIDPTVRVKDLTDAELSRIQDIINENYTVEGELQRVVTGNIKRLKDINAYRGLRHKAGLPSRGQRTRTNARTRRGRKVAVGGTQKKAASKTQVIHIWQKQQSHQSRRRKPSVLYLLVRCTSWLPLITRSLRSLILRVALWLPPVPAPAASVGLKKEQHTQRK